MTVATVTGDMIRPRRHKIYRFTIEISSGHPVHILAAGSIASAKRLFWIHGYTANAELYADLIAQLANDGWYVVAPDAPGHGLTPSLVKNSQELEAYVDVLAEVVQQCNMQDAYMGGHSMGGRLSLELAVRFPDSAGWIGMSSITGEPWDEIMKRCSRGIRGEGKVLRLLGKLAADFINENPLIQLTQGPHIVPMVVHNLRHPLPFWNPGRAILKASSSAELLDRYPAGKPAILLHGERDWGVPLTVAHSAREITEGLLHAMPGTGHAMPVAHPKQTFRQLTNLLSPDYSQAAPLIPMSCQPSAEPALP